MACPWRAGCGGRWLDDSKLFWDVYDARESLETARQWEDLGKGAVALTLEGVVGGLFEST